MPKIQFDIGLEVEFTEKQLEIINEIKQNRTKYNCQETSLLKSRKRPENEYLRLKCIELWGDYR